MRNVAADIRYALRQFGQAPLFALAAILTLALGIGGTTAIFSLTDAIVLRSLPVVNPGSLYRIGSGDNCCVDGGPQDEWGLFSYPLYQRIKGATPEFEQITAFQDSPWEVSVRRSGSGQAPLPLHAEFVTGSYFSTFGIQSFFGRLISRDDDRASAPPIAVLSYHAWQSTFGGDRTVLGSNVAVNGHPFTVVGIAPPGFFGETLRSDPPELWLPMQQEPLVRGVGSLLHESIPAWLRVIGRLKPGVTTAGMSDRLTALVRHWMVTDSGYPASWMPETRRSLPRQFVKVIPAGSGVEEMKEESTRSLQILFVACGLVLLIACANVANLLLARGRARQAQTSIRLAIGAPRSRIVAQALTESVLLAVGGGIVGLLVSDLAGRLLLNLAFHGSRYVPISTRPSLLVLLFAFGLSLATGVVFGVAPALLATRTDPIEALRGAGRSAGDHSTLVRKGLLAMQATLSVVLVTGAALLGRSLGNLEHQNVGFKIEHRVLVEMLPPPPSYSPDQLDTMYRELEGRLGRIPGVRRVGLALYAPFTDNWSETISVAGQSGRPLSDNSNSSWDRVSPEFLDTLALPMVRGREFNDGDDDREAPVAIVNEAFVKRFLPHEDPLDQHFGMDDPANAGTFRIIGVARNGKFNNLRRPARPMFFVPLAQHVKYSQAELATAEGRSHFISSAVLETDRPPATLEPAVRNVLADVDPNLTLDSVYSLPQILAMNFDSEHAVADVASLFGFVALLLAAVGLYGVTAYTVVQRTREIGVRMALGADRPKVIMLVLQSAAWTVGIGLLLGIPLAIGAGRLMASQLYGVGAWDPAALSLAVGSLATCALVAAIIPAAKAAAVAPTDALRVE
jgi:predicted permease